MYNKRLLDQVSTLKNMYEIPVLIIEDDTATNHQQPETSFVYHELSLIVGIKRASTTD
jgi:ERCC4-type nuclease